MDDDSTDDTMQVVLNAEVAGLRIYYYRLKKPEGVQWRDSAAFINCGIAYALHELGCEHVFITHPEIIPGTRLIEAGISMLGNGTDRFNAKGYYLSIAQQAQIDTVDLTLGIEEVHHIPGFYNDPVPPYNPDYTPRAIDAAATWGSWIFGGFSANGWRNFGGVFESEVWGAVDVEMFNRAQHLGVRTVTPQHFPAMVIHQNHDDPNANTLTPRDQDAWVKKLEGITFENRYHLISEERWAPKGYMP
jgi:hypothetical protein